MQEVKNKHGKSTMEKETVFTCGVIHYYSYIITNSNSKGQTFLYEKVCPFSKEEREYGTLSG